MLGVVRRPPPPAGFGAVVLLVAAALAGGCGSRGAPPADRPAAGGAVDAPAMATAVRAELLHAWRGYERYAWGHDELVPLSRGGRDWHRTSLLMTPVDALEP